MIIELWSLGKQDKKEFQAAVEMYEKRLQFYSKYKIETIDNSKINKNIPKEQLLEKEAELIYQRLQERDLLIVLDENGKSISSVKFAEKLNGWLNTGPNRIIFLIGGSYGISSQIQQTAAFSLSLSALTFPHQLVRLLFTEQLYRAFTILKNEKYHHA